MLLQPTTTQRPATDLGYLLHKNARTKSDTISRSVCVLRRGGQRRARGRRGRVPVLLVALSYSGEVGATLTTGSSPHRISDPRPAVNVHR
jgi:Hen1-like subunit of RNA repair complex